MKVVVVRHKPCNQFYTFLGEYLEDIEYLGFSIQKYGAVHYFKAGDRVLRMPCKACVLREMLGVAPLVDQPRFENGVFVFKFLYTKALARRLSIGNKDSCPLFVSQLASLRRALLSARQREALGLFAEGGLRRVSETLGVSKPAAYRLVKRALQKLAHQQG